MTLSLTEMQKIAESRGGKCISKEYFNAITKMRWKCKKGHVWEARPQDIKRGTWCPPCSGNIKLTIKEMQKIAKSRGGSCLSNIYINNETKLKWLCKEGHAWGAIPNSIKRGTWCNVCSSLNTGQKLLKYTIEDMQIIANLRKGKCLSEKYFGAFRKLWWQCNEEHQWEAIPSNIKRGWWCPYCAKRVKLTLEEMRKVAKQRGGDCISNEYTNARSKIKWSCKEGHTWGATPTSIRSKGTWCPVCSIGISERICRQYFEVIFNEQFQKIRPKWLKTENGTLMELDGYCEKLGLAFEYHGVQHYEYVKKFHQKYTLEERKEMDDLKKSLCKQQNITLIEIPYTVSYEDMGSYIIKKCNENGIKIQNITTSLNYKLFQIYSPERLKEMQEIALLREGECISQMYVNSQEKLRWKCGKGHIFESNANNIKNGNWCPYCIGKKKTLDDIQKILDDIRQIAVERGGKCLSERYISANHKLFWQCKEGHIWMAIPKSILKGHWCRICGRISTTNKQKLSLEDMHILARKRNGECISKDYINVGTKLEWKCEKGHIWSAKPNNIKSGYWCPECYREKRKGIF